MAPSPSSRIPELVSAHAGDLLSGWLAKQKATSSTRLDLIGEAELEDQSKRFLEAFRTGLASNDLDELVAPEWSDVRDFLSEISRSRAMQGFKPSETATFILSLKQPMFELLRKELAADPLRLADDTWRASTILDRLGLLTVESYQATREEIIVRQQHELLELSTPVVRLWDRILALPLVGTLDSARTQVVMESLLERIVETGSEVAIIDITGVPTVDTLVAQHLLKTVAATRLMGADCIISGIRPQIAQTIVHLGVDLGAVVTKATLADAFAVALKRTGATLGEPAASER
jgi:rsbT co-antagonist protein RsbR